MRKIFIGIGLLLGLAGLLNAQSNVQLVIKTADGAILENNATVDITEYKTEDGMDVMEFESMVINPSNTAINVVGKLTKTDSPLSDAEFQMCFGACLAPGGVVSPTVEDLDTDGEPFSLHYKFPSFAQAHTGAFTFSCFPAGGSMAPGTELVTVNLNFKYKGGGTGLTNIGLQRVMMVQSGDNCTLTYNSQGKRLALEVYNLLGMKVFAAPLPAGSSSYTLPVRLQRGVHIFRITEGGKPAFVQKYLIK